MSKAPINFESIDGKSLAYLNAFVAARIAIAKEDMRHMAEMKPLKAKLEAIHENREIDLKNGMNLDDVIRKHSSVEVDKAIRAENNLHKETLKPLNEDLKSTYAFMSDGMYDSYVRKIELGKRGDFIKCIRTFLENIGIEEVSQSALCKLSEQIADRLGVSVSNSKQLLEEGVFSSTMRDRQFNKLFMSIFCDILVLNRIIIVNMLKSNSGLASVKSCKLISIKCRK